MTDGIHEKVIPQLADIKIDPERPMIITDADEVLFNFMKGMEIFLEANGMYFDWQSFALRGNIKLKHDNSAVEDEKIPHLLDQFFHDYAANLPAVEGAAETLEDLSQHAQVIVLSNVPPKYAEKRLAGLKRAGMDFPLIANIGAKGRVVSYLTRSLNHPSFFIDDIPHNHASVEEHADYVHRLHYIADERLAQLLGPAENSTARLNNWTELSDHILSHIETKEN
ncbi:hypothetical protein [Sneathiella limimaris]|uniref:hypothetical protein n=1 Tax=Sneathiella limimaris TaxID=1964213 RepID=UPI00146D1132|nr:hypothetical protein [Sneathiella limimaris]